ncbi:GGDEF/EAL domain-containing response regulator [Chitinimonas koreensis]|uniref:GGDEF/EAL domain-containing response regulator n=1 Tax=Chitinimonas koreensis TaxID=356302 RepID=UPI00041895D5|nr:EAL domain-containing response regulator [Chitinimonas koreensis]QNM95995.1 EAL domain-containing response regulator [Chitinimonas koreensis]
MVVNPELSIMVVEDSAVQRLHALDLLANLGVQRTLEAENGRHALEVLACSEKPDILITDLEMPDMDGVELIRHIAEQHMVSALIVVSSRETTLLSTVETMALEHGLTVLGIAQKPLSYDNLGVLIDKFHADAQATAQTESNYAFTPADLRQAIVARELVLHYQPKVTTHSGVMRGVEALVRWQHPVHGLLSPYHFIPLAEENGVIDELTDWVLEAALKQLRDWHARGLTISVAVNLSAKSLSTPDLTDRIAAVTNRIGIEPKYLVLEITETAVMSDLALSLGTLARLRLKGFGLSIDDFGTGFSSMQQLSRIPFTELKIDRSLVHGASEKPHLHVMLQSTIEMGKKLHLTTLAEGVENPADWQLIRLLGCDVAQGFYVAKPMAGDALAGWLKQGTQHLRPPRPGMG